MTRSLVVRVSTIAGCDVKISLIADTRAEANPAAVVIGLRLIEGEQRSLTGGIRDIRIGGNAEERDMRHALAKGATGRDVVHIKASAGGIVRIERQTEQSFFADKGDFVREIKKRSWLHGPRR